MSYDLFFCREKGAKLDFEEVAGWLLKRPHCKRSADTQVWYENPATGVYFCIEHDRVEEPDERPIPPDYENVELVLNMNFNRPSFFAHEAMAVVEHLISRFALLVVDDQSPPQVMNAHSLVQSWSQSNDWGVKALIKEKNSKSPCSCRAKSPWHGGAMLTPANSCKTKLEMAYLCRRSCSGGARSRARSARRLHGLAGIPTVVPESDYVAVVRERKRFLRPSEREVGVMSTEVIQEIAGEFLHTYDASRSLRILREENVAKAERALLKMDLTPNRDEFVQVASDGFVDTESLS